MSGVLIQANNLEVHDLPDGYIVYQAERDRVHYLNQTAAVIFEFCDGKHEPDEIVAHVAKAFELSPSAHDEIRAGLDSLLKEGLVQSSSK
jgi:coenzyme PQQ synthesis protein D (PqqD)